MNLIGKLFFAVRISQDFDQLSYHYQLANIANKKYQEAYKALEGALPFEYSHPYYSYYCGNS